MLFGSRDRALQRFADATYAAVCSLAREPSLFGPGRIPDSVDGRFESVCAHAAIVFVRLKPEPEQKGLARAFSDRIVQGFDDSLRELGVGDMSLPRKLRRLAESAWGRFAAYDPGLAAQDPAALAQALARNVWNEEDAAFAGPLADRLLACLKVARETPLDRLGDPSAWLTNRRQHGAAV